MRFSVIGPPLTQQSQSLKGYRRSMVPLFRKWLPSIHVYSVAVFFRSLINQILRRQNKSSCVSIRFSGVKRHVINKVLKAGSRKYIMLYIRCLWQYPIKHLYRNYVMEEVLSFRWTAMRNIRLAMNYRWNTQSDHIFSDVGEKNLNWHSYERADITEKQERLFQHLTYYKFVI